MARRAWLAAMAVLALAACGGAGGSGLDAAVDTAPDTATDAATDGAFDTSPDAATDAATDAAIDAVIDTATDASFDASPDTAIDTPAQTVFAAVPGQRCTPSTRVGEVVVYGQADPATPLEASAVMVDRQDAWAPAPKLADAACTFFLQAPPAYCESCPVDTLCAPDATCQAMPAPATDIVLVLSAGGAAQTFPASGTSGAYGLVTLPGRTFSVAVSWAGLTVTLGDTAVPDGLDGLSGTEGGPWNAPTAMDLAWTPAAGDTSVFTHIPINHHAGGPTYTECLVPASSGALHVDGAMLAPLAVVTGLEFQGIEHARFAAAKTPLGCVELRFRVQQYVNLTGP